MAIVAGKIYRHFKGKEYKVEGIVTHSETLEQLVLYRPMYDYEKLWVRPISMWEEIVTDPNGNKVKRFTEKE